MARQRQNGSRTELRLGGNRGARPAELPDDIAADPDVDPESAARTIGLRLLTARARTRAELADAFATRAIPTATADRVLDRFVEVGLLNDRAFAENYTRARHEERGLAGREIARQLRDKGVADEDVAAATAAIDPEDERRTARQLVEKKLRSLQALPVEVQTRRLIGLLARKGYSSSVAYDVVRSALANGCGAELEAWDESEIDDAGRPDAGSG